MHTADYNVNVLSKSLKLLEHRFLSFSELNDVRIAYQAYEAGDMKGMIIDKHTLLRTLKMCGRVVAPMKLMHRVKHMKVHFDEKGRIQLYEFMDLLVLCDLSDDVNIEEYREGAIDKNWRNLFKMDAFDPLFVTGEEKVLDHLNQVFIKTELDYGEVKLGDKKLPKDNSVNTEARKEQVRYHGQRYKELQRFIDGSTREVKKTKAGTIRTRPISAPTYDRFRTPAFAAGFPYRPHTVGQIHYNPANYQHRQTSPKRKLRPASAPVKVTSTTDNPPPCQTSDSEGDGSYPMADKLQKLLEYTKNRDRHGIQSAPSSLYVEASEPPVGVQMTTSDSKYYKPFPPSMHFNTLPYTSEESSSEMSESQHALPPWMKSVPYQRPETPQCVTYTDTVSRQYLIDSLQYELETVEERTVQVLNEEIDVLLPGYRKKRDERLRNRKPPLPPKKVRRKKQGLTEEQIKRLTNPDYRGYLATHEKQCDARSLGIAPSREGKRERKQSTPRDTKRNSAASSEHDRLFSRHLRNDSVDLGSIESGNIYTDSLKLQSYLLSSRMAGHLETRKMDRERSDLEKFKRARVGTAAVLHDYLIEKETAKEAERDIYLRQISDDEDHGIEFDRRQSDLEGQRFSHIGVLGNRMSNIDELKLNGMDLSEYDQFTVLSREEQKAKKSKSRSSRSPVSSVKSRSKTPPNRSSQYEEQQTASAMKRLSLALAKPEKGKGQGAEGTEGSEEFQRGKNEVRFAKKSWKNNKKMKQLVDSKKLNIRLKQSPSE
ncbi:uncharacterized protein LOC144448339 isoform X2 [Glandiceps talaboti]